jgi:beta-lactamase superfamily II metal-dependent hydrolase
MIGAGAMPLGRQVVLGLAALCVGEGLRGQSLELRFLDVGQGDAIFMRSGGKVALVDAGRSDAIVARLDALGVDTIDLLIVSHNHADHLGGVPAVLRRFPVRFYLDNGVPASTDVSREALYVVEGLGITYLTDTARTIRLGDATLRILGSPWLEPDPDDQNNASVGVVVEQGTFKALLTGDSQVPELGAWLAQINIPDVDVLKAGHHGSDNGLTPDWLERTSPEVVVISVGRDNAYGHPHPWALDEYRATGAAIFRTDRDGEVIVLVCADGRYSVATQAKRDEPALPCPEAPLHKRGP